MTYACCSCCLLDRLALINRLAVRQIDKYIAALLICSYFLADLVWRRGWNLLLNIYCIVGGTFIPENIYYMRNFSMHCHEDNYMMTSVMMIWPNCLCLIPGEAVCYFSLTILGWGVVVWRIGRVDTGGELLSWSASYPMIRHRGISGPTSVSLMSCHSDRLISLWFMEDYVNFLYLTSRSTVSWSNGTIIKRVRYCTLYEQSAPRCYLNIQYATLWVCFCETFILPWMNNVNPLKFILPTLTLWSVVWDSA